MFNQTTKVLNKKFTSYAPTKSLETGEIHVKKYV